MNKNLDRQLGHLQQSAAILRTMAEHSVLQPLAEPQPDWREVVDNSQALHRQLAKFEQEVQRSSFLSYVFHPRALPGNPQDVVDFLGPKPQNPAIENSYKHLKEECVSAKDAQVSKADIAVYNAKLDRAGRKFQEALRQLHREEEEEEEDEQVDEDSAEVMVLER